MKNCRFCKSEDLVECLDLGEQPIANNLLSKNQLNEKEPFYPLVVYFCRNCNLVQLLHDISPDEMFKNYFYVTSKTEAFRIHFKKYAEEIVKRMNLSEKDLVIDVGSNDGTLLKNFQKYGVRTLGVDPAENIVQIALANGVETVNDYFTEKTAKKILNEKGKAKVITANNTFSQVGHYDEFMCGVQTLLDKDGVLVIEVPYLVDLMENLEFDTIYHEHHGYFTATPFQHFFKLWGMELLDIERQAVHGGTIRVFAKWVSSNRPVSKNIYDFITLEKNLNLDSIETYRAFASKIEKIKEKLTSILLGIKSQGKRIVGYGAPAKATVLLNYCKIGTDVIAYATDSNPIKQNHFIPGVRVPILPEEKIKSDNPDYVLILAWNFLDEILVKEKSFREHGGKFVVPIPNPMII